MADRRTAEIPRDFLKMLRNRPHAHEVRNSARSAQLSGDFAEFSLIGRDFPESLSFTVEPAGRRIGDPPRFFRIP